MWYLYLSLLFTFSHVFGEDVDVDYSRDDCFIYKFDQGFDDEFTHGSGICQGFLPWTEGDYDSIDIDPFHVYGNSFVRPGLTHSCMLSKPFPMSAGGKLELNVYMDLSTDADYIRVIVYEVQESGNNNNVGDFTSSLAYSNFIQSSWNTFEIEINGIENFSGQVAISGRTASTILVDSIRYLPPPTEEYNDICSIYGPVTYECVESSFEGYDLTFDSTNRICAGAGSWHQAPIDDGSSIQPIDAEIPSCISTPIFVLSTSGTLRVNVSITSNSYFDTVLVAMNDDEDHIHSAAYSKLINNDFKSGANHTLELEIEDITDNYDAQITFVAFKTEEATVAVRSFRFTPTSWDGKECKSLVEVRKRDIVGK